MKLGTAFGDLLAASGQPRSARRSSTAHAQADAAGLGNRSAVRKTSSRSAWRLRRVTDAGGVATLGVLAGRRGTSARQPW